MDVYMYGTVWIVISQENYFYHKPSESTEIKMTPVFIFTYLRAINYACISDTSQAMHLP